MQNVDITAQRYAGGIVGVLVGPTSSITNSYVTGEIKLVQGEVVGSGQFAGGIASGLEGGSQIINSYSATDITTSYQDAWGEGGIAGYAYGGSTVTNSFWDTETPSTVLITEGGGTGKTTLQMKTQSTFTDAGWDFTDIWEMDENLNNGYASLRTEGVDAQPLCEETIVTASAARVACDLQYSAPVTAEDTGTTTWAARYRKSGDTQWTYVDIKNPATGFMNFTGLDPETNYDLSLRASNNLFDDWLTIDGTTLAADSDVDADGTLDTQEDASPNDGDINGDGVLDSLQANMTSFLSPVSGQYVALETNCEDNYNLQIGMESDAQPDSGYNYPTGLLSFVARGCDVGSTQTFNVYFFGEYSDQLTVRKSRGASYLAVPGATVTAVTIGGSTASKASYQVQDGGELDDDGVADGNIVDPVGLASPVQVQLASTGRNSSLVATVALMSIALAALMAKLNPRKV